jgi:hypothetical protein
MPAWKSVSRTVYVSNWLANVLCSPAHLDGALLDMQLDERPKELPHFISHFHHLSCRNCMSACLSSSMHHHVCMKSRKEQAGTCSLLTEPMRLPSQLLLRLTAGMPSQAPSYHKFTRSLHPCFHSMTCHCHAILSRQSGGQPYHVWLSKESWAHLWDSVIVLLQHIHLTHQHRPLLTDAHNLEPLHAWRQQTSTTQQFPASCMHAWHHVVRQQQAFMVEALACTMARHA